MQSQSSSGRNFSYAEYLRIREDEFLPMIQVREYQWIPKKPMVVDYPHCSGEGLDSDGQPIECPNKGIIFKLDSHGQLMACRTLDTDQGPTRYPFTYVYEKAPCPFHEVVYSHLPQDTLMYYPESKSSNPVLVRYLHLPIDILTEPNVPEEMQKAYLLLYAVDEGLIHKLDFQGGPFLRERFDLTEPDSDWLKTHREKRLQERQEKNESHERWYNNVVRSGLRREFNARVEQGIPHNDGQTLFIPQSQFERYVRTADNTKKVLNEAQNEDGTLDFSKIPEGTGVIKNLYIPIGAEYTEQQIELEEFINKIKQSV